MAMATTSAKMSVVSSKRHLPKRYGGMAHSKMSGASRRLPATSASNQVAQVAAGPAKPMSLDSTRPAVAVDELMSAIGTTQTSAKRAAPAGIAKASRSPERSITQAPAAAASGTPTAIQHDAASELVVTAVAKNAPVTSAGHTRLPRNRMRASATPVGGHSVVAVGLAQGSSKVETPRPK